MSTNIPQVQGTNTIIDAEFVSLTVTFANDANTTQITRSLYFSSSFRDEVIDGNNYSQMGGLIGVSAHQRDISASGYDTSIVLTGLDPNYIYWVAGGPAATNIPVPGQADIPAGYYPLIKGSQIQIRRGFYDSSYALVNTVLRYTGIVTSYSIAETRDGALAEITDNYTINLQCSAIRRVLENRIAGRSTNPTSWKYWFPTDTSMDRVPGLESQQFDFGKPVVTTTGGTGGGGTGGNNEFDEVQQP